MAPQGFKKTPVKVLFLATRYKGDFRLFNDMILGLDPAFFDTRLCYLSGRPDGKNTLDRFNKAIYLATSSASGIRRFMALVKVMRSFRPDILHCHRHKPTVYGVVANLLCKSRAIVLSHVHGLGRTRSQGRRLTNKFILKGVRRVLTVSDGVREDVLKTNAWLNPAKVVTVRNGITVEDIDRFRDTREGARKRLGVMDGELVFATVGRLAPTKGHKYLISALPDVVSAIPSAKLFIIGEGPLEAELKEMALAVGVSSRVGFFGWRDDVPFLLPGFDVFVFPSVAEGLPAALLEAMAARLPIVASSVGGIPEVFGGAGFGRLVPPGDVRALAEAMKEVGAFPRAERKEMGEAARKRVEESFTKEAMCRRLTEVYTEVIGAG